MVCKGICIRHKAVKPTGAGRYASGQKRCQICEIFLNWDAGHFCPCCGYRLRGKPRNLKYKEKFRSQSGAAAPVPTGVEEEPGTDNAAPVVTAKIQE